MCAAASGCVCACMCAAASGCVCCGWRMRLCVCMCVSWERRRPIRSVDADRKYQYGCVFLCVHACVCCFCVRVRVCVFVCVCPYILSFSPVSGNEVGHWRTQKHIILLCFYTLGYVCVSLCLCVVFMCVCFCVCVRVPQTLPDDGSHLAAVELLRGPPRREVAAGGGEYTCTNQFGRPI